MKKAFGSYTFENAERFEQFLEDNMKRSYDVNSFYEDFIDTVCSNGSSSYELGGFYTKSGHPETINFDRSDTEVDEDEWETIFEF